METDNNFILYHYGLGNHAQHNLVGELEEEQGLAGQNDLPDNTAFNRARC